MSTERSLDEIMEERDAPEGGAPPPPGEDRSPPVEQPRDQRGRWASKGDDGDDGDDGGGRPPPGGAQQRPPAEEKKPPDGFVPIQALDARLAKNDERFAAVMQQNAQLMQALAAQNAPKPTPQTAPDFFDNPDAAFDYRIGQALSPVQQQLQAQTERFSSMMAVEKFGLEPVKEAYSALAMRVQQLGPQDPVYHRIMRAEHPYGELVRWHQEQSALQRYGADPEAFIKAEVERRLAEQQGQPGTRGPAPPMPQSITSAPNVGARATTGIAGPRPLSEIMGR